MMFTRSYKILFICLICLFSAAAIVQAAPVIVYIPQDDRPASLDDVIQTGTAAGMEVRVPPLSLLASRGTSGNPDALWDWLNREADGADDLIVSADTLIYGGLVPSRLHTIDESVLKDRVQRLRSLKAQHSGTGVYVFSTLLRSPHGTAGGVDVYYYEQWGEKIFRLGALTDKRETAGLSRAEAAELAALEQAVPPPYLADWRQRRAKNFRVNLALWDAARSGEIDFFLMGRDDASPYSDSHRELRQFLAQRQDRPDVTQFITLAGADQLGMLLLSRVGSYHQHRTPLVAPIYPDGPGPATVPSYQDSPAGSDLRLQILAAGALPISNPDRADLTLAVYTPLDGKTREAGISANKPPAAPSAVRFAQRINDLVRADRQLAVADIAYANGSDNALMDELNDHMVWNTLAAYAGWNTASNTIGSALGQGLLSPAMEPSDRHRLLARRLLDEWAFQANVRPALLKDILLPQHISDVQLGPARPLLEEETTARLHRFAFSYISMPMPDFTIRYPWDRMFEIAVDWKQPSSDEENGSPELP